MKLLVIDDNEEIREMISFFCTSIRVDCTVVNDGKKGLEAIHKNNEFDLILLDVGMPDFSGVDIVNSLKLDGVLESKNVVIMTASSDTKIQDEIKNSGVKDILKKPYSLEELTELIEKFRKEV